MSLRTRVSIFLSLCIAFGVLTSAFGARMWLEGGFRSIESNDAISNMGRFRSSLEQSLADMDRATADYAFWDDAHHFVLRPSQEFIDENMGFETLHNQGWDSVLILDLSGKVQLATWLDEDNKRVLKAPEFILAAAPSILARWQPAEPTGSFRGIVQLDGRAHFMAVRRILRSNRTGNGDGFFATFRVLDGKEFQRIAGLTLLNAKLEPVFEDMSKTDEFRIDLLSEDKLAIRSNYHDVNGKPAFGISVEIARDIYKQGQASVLAVMWGTCLFGVLLVIVILFLIEKMVLARLTRLSNDVKHVTASSNFSDRVGNYGTDELGHLGKDINDTLRAHENLNNDLVAERERVEALAKEKTVESEKMQTLVRILSHDISNHLVVSTMHLSRMIKAAEDQKLLEGLNKVQRATHQIKDVIDMVREMIALRDGKKTMKLRSISLNECIDACLKNLEMLIAEKSMHVAVDVDPSVLIHAERRTLTQQVLSNITSNAIKFSDAGGSLKFSAAMDGDTVKLYVIDQGIGMPEDPALNLFDSHVATSRAGTSGEAGTGFGMPVVKFYMSQYGGQISVKSRDRKQFGKESSGTTFELTFKAGQTATE